MFRRDAAVYQDDYEQDVEFFQSEPYARTRVFDQDRILKGALVGAAAGLLAGFVMTQFQKAWAAGQEELQRHQEKDEQPKHRRAAQQESRGRKADDATVKAANKVSKAVFNKALTRDQKKIAGPAVHYGFAAAMGALYGALAEATDLTTAGYGTFFGTLLFLGADELAVPALKLAPPPQEVALDKHLYGWVSHVVYGAALEGSRQGLRRVAG